MNKGKSQNFDQIKEVFKAKLSQLPENAEKTDGRTGKQILRLEIKIEKINILAWLQRQDNPQKLYWSNRDHSFETGGIGQAHAVTYKNDCDYSVVFSRLTKNLNPGFKRMRYYGGFRFNKSNSPDSDWKYFGVCRFIIPLFEIINEAKSCYFACNILYDPQKEVSNLAEQILSEFEKISFIDKFYKVIQANLEERSDRPDKTGWKRNVETVLDIFEHKELGKIVLARKSKFSFSNKVGPFSLLLSVKKTNPDSYQFCLQPGDDQAFIGGSPERLYARRGSRIQSEAVAGTRPRGKTKDEDRALEKSLLRNEKEINEHLFVHQSVENSLHKLCSSVESSGKVSVVKLARLQHLTSYFKGELYEYISDAEILEELHPTPAVGGIPKEKAIKKIDELETFDRGWYAGPVGWVGIDSSEFCVAIRTGHIRNNCLTLYSGAGIVKGSEPESEWDEIENKISNFLRILDINGESGS